MTDPRSTVTLLVTCTHQDVDEQSDLDGLVAGLAAQLQQPVIPFPIDQNQQALTDILADLMRHGVGRIVTMPTFLSVAEYDHYAVTEIVEIANRRWPFIHHHLGSPLEWSDWLMQVDAQLEAISKADIYAEDTAVILVGHGDVHATVNSDLTKLAHLVYEAHDFGWVDSAFVCGKGPSVCDLITHFERLGAKHVMVLPYMLYAGQTYTQLQAQLESVQSISVPISLATPISHHVNFTDLIVKQHALALEDHSLLPPTQEEIEQTIAAAIEQRDREKAGLSTDNADEFQEMRARIDAILPPRYQGRTDEVSAAPMSAADLVFDDEGAVLWDQIFGVDDPNNPYCELALAGGPSHRGELLEAVNRADCLAEPGKYAAAIAECGRGINMITGMSIVQSKVPGWIGVQCDSDEMAIWLVRAIIVENVMVRREEDVLYLPVGPHYTLKDQIKSIVTVTAKTWHYWIEHITYQELMGAVG